MHYKIRIKYVHDDGSLNGFFLFHGALNFLHVYASLFTI